ncbi:hypothetical protein N7456_000587 [Penicillium angulare]|uniref:Alpha/beta hydrolase fold-3 domain-containing protein n=1 Tax=Penicillium angulare TaxID=116970 RepID=A0A9W9KSD3_9EURO|nr:hypothetical protein N7456_000587 [Penicillium angulare]
MADQQHDPTIFKDFYVHNLDYKVISHHKILLSILVPKSLVTDGADIPTKRPLITTFHGGWLIGGSRLYSPWIAPWLLDLALSRQAILVFPDYRLLPEATGLDILSDIDSFWSWISKNLQSTLQFFYPSHDIKADLDRILVYGDSAGGYCIAQSLLRHPEMNFRAAIMAYPMVHFRDRYWSEKYDKPIFGAPMLPEAIIEDHLKGLTPTTVFSSDGDPDKVTTSTRMSLALSIVQNGRFIDFLGREPQLYPIDLLPQAKKLPPFIWLFHGKQDSAVPLEQSEYFFEHLRKHAPHINVRFDVRDGEHGLGGEERLSEEWIQKGIEGVSSVW